ncbi:MAG: magnesium-translocating P-type ATPase [Chthoniobacterales bacterium]|nr:magnesium-translocating P-type ATPase [Chthoniobacterales bacterium]
MSIASLFSKTFFTIARTKATSTTEVLSEYDQKLITACVATPEEAFTVLHSSEEGLMVEQAQETLATFGPNDLGKKSHQGFLKEIFIRCKNPLVIQLVIICTVLVFTGDIPSATIVGFMILLSIGFSYFQEHRSSQAVEKLRAMVQTNCHVLRQGHEVEIPMSQIVPGDLVFLQAGSLIAADMRLVAAKDLFVSQSSLTGESMPVEKSVESGLAPNQSCTSALELSNALFQGSNVISGSGKALVVNTGVRTYFGAISQKLSSAPVLTSFDRGISGFTWLMIRFMCVMVSVVFLIIGLRNHNWTEALLFGLSVAVGLTPEMLPMIVVVNLAKGAMAMSRKKVIVKKLNAIQNFGAINILCTDKTGTLTQDRVILEKHLDVTGRDSEDVLRYAYMNSYYQTGLRGALDACVLSHTDLDVDRGCKKVDEIPFDFQRKRMSVVVDYEGDHVLVCKGAVEDIYKACSYYQVDDEVYMMIDLIKSDLMEEYESLSRDGYRVLGIAYREFSQEKTTFAIGDESELIFLGYIAFLDPPKESAYKAIASLKSYGVATKILTGDNSLVTRKICKEVGIDAGEVITGDQLGALTEEQLGELAEKNNVFARLSPAQKERIIVALQKRGHVVGYMGDGINDALSLRVADVGISVDTGMDVAKESADIILLEKSLMVLEDGILEGRKVFGNIIKYIRMGASSNFGNMFSMVGSSCFLPFLPISPLQLLVNNLLYDTSQVGIPSDHVDPEYLQKPRQWNIGNIGRYMICIGPLSSIFDYATFFLMLYFFHCSLFSDPGTSAEMKTYYEKLFHTGWFVESILTQTLIVHIIRTAKIPFVQSIASPFLLTMTFLIMAIGGILPYTPLGAYFEMVPLPGVYWFWIVGFLLCYATITHHVNVWCLKKFGMN